MARPTPVTAEITDEDRKRARALPIYTGRDDLPKVEAAASALAVARAEGYLAGVAEADDDVQASGYAEGYAAGHADARAEILAAIEPVVTPAPEPVVHRIDLADPTALS